MSEPAPLARPNASRPNGKWRARYRDDSGRERARHFDRKLDAQRWLNEITSSVLTGNYVDPSAGKVTFKRFYDDWSKRQLWVPATRANADLATRSVPFADLPHEDDPPVPRRGLGEGVR